MIDSNPKYSQVPCMRPRRLDRGWDRRPSVQKSAGRCCLALRGWKIPFERANRCSVVLTRPDGASRLLLTPFASTAAHRQDSEDVATRDGRGSAAPIWRSGLGRQTAESGLWPCRSILTGSRWWVVVSSFPPPFAGGEGHLGGAREPRTVRLNRRGFRRG
jgi:hypothetical protein